MAGGNDYLIPFGIDGKEFFTGMGAINSELDAVGKNSKDATAEMQKGFENATKAAEGLSKAVDADAAATAKLKDQAKGMGQALGDAIGKGANTQEVEKKLTKFNDLVAQVQAKAKAGIKLEADASKLAAFENAIENSADQLEVLNQVVAFTKDKLAALDPNSDEFKELNDQLVLAEGLMEGLGISSNETSVKTKSLKTQLRELKTTLAEMEMAGQGGTAEFQALSEQAGELEDQIGDVAARVRVLSSDTKNLDVGIQALQGLAGGFAAAQGAAALFGQENENVQLVIQKVTGAMAVLQGIQALATALNKDSALSVLLLGRAQTAATVSTTALAGATTAEAGATVVATTATRGFTAALLANPLIAIAVLITAVVAALIAFTSGSDDAKEATEELNKALADQNKLLSLDEAGIKRRTDLYAAQAKAAGAAESEITKIQGQGLASRRNITAKALDEFVQNTYNNAELRKKIDSDANSKIEDQYIEFTEKLKDLDNEIAIQRLEVTEKRKKEGVEAAKKAKDAAKEATELAKKQSEEEKKILEQRTKFLKETTDAETTLIKDQYNRERTALLNAANDKITALENEKALTLENQQARADAVVAINNALYAAIDEVDKKQATEQAQLQFRSRELMVELEKEGAKKELEQMQLDYEAKRAEINNAFKDEEETRVRLIKSVNDAEVAATRLAKNRLANEALEKEAERAELEVETAAKFVGKIPYIEEQKQIAILEVKLRYAKIALQQLLDQGNEEGSTIVLSAKKTINDLTKGLDDATKGLNKKTGKGIFNLQTLLFGDQGPEGNEAIGKALNAQYEAIKQITDFIVDQYQRQIDKKQEVIDMYDDSIKDMEDQLDQEKDARDKGFANNVATLEAEIAETKRQRDEEFRQQEELRKKQEAAKRAQMIIDTAVQASNLITAATEIFAALASIPFVGIPLAIATVGIMLGGFIAAKAQAFSSVGGQSFGDGGWIDGESHAKGGQKYRSIDGRGGVVELEGGEHVTKKSQAQKYAEVLDAINEGDLGGMSDYAFRMLMDELGIELESDQHLEALDMARDRDDLKHFVLMGSTEPSEELVAIREDVAYLANRRRSDRDRWEDDKYMYERFGNKTTKTRKK